MGCTCNRNSCMCILFLAYCDMVFMHVIQLIQFTCVFNTNCCMSYGICCDMVCTPNTNCCMLQSFSWYIMIRCVFSSEMVLTGRKADLEDRMGKRDEARRGLLIENQCCPPHGKPCEIHKENNYFALPKYHQQMLSSNSKFVWSPSHTHEVCMSVQLEL